MDARWMDLINVVCNVAQLIILVVLTFVMIPKLGIKDEREKNGTG